MANVRRKRAMGLQDLVFFYSGHGTQPAMDRDCSCKQQGQARIIIWIVGCLAYFAPFSAFSCSELSSRYPEGRR